MQLVMSIVNSVTAAANTRQESSHSAPRSSDSSSTLVTAKVQTAQNVDNGIRVYESILLQRSQQSHGTCSTRQSSNDQRSLKQLHAVTPGRLPIVEYEKKFLWQQYHAAIFTVSSSFTFGLHASSSLSRTQCPGRSQHTKGRWRTRQYIYQSAFTRNS